MKSKIKRFAPLLFLLPFVIGSIGYILSGNSVTDSLYAGYTLYFSSPVSDSYNVWIEIARWTAPLATATAILSIFQNIWRSIVWWFQCFFCDSVAVYADSDLRIVFDEKTKVFYAGRKPKPRAKSHIIMLDSDMDSLGFYEEHKEKLAGGRIYIGLREMESGLMRENQNVIFFDINGGISRLLWKQAALWKDKKETLSVAIWGGGDLAENILRHGLLLNLYSDKQKIAYHMIGDESFRIKHPKLPTMNGDEILFHGAEGAEVWETVQKADIIVIAQEVSAAALQAIAVNGRNARIYYYSRIPGDAGGYLQMANLIPFGRDAEIYTDENIRREKLVEEAKNINAEYAAQYGGEADWNKLSGFLQSSNISAADFGHVMAELLKESGGDDDEMFARLEHIRWCRFHYLNYWTYGEPENGKNKDSVKMIHKCLCPYERLSEEEREKDRANVREARKKAGAE